MAEWTNGWADKQLSGQTAKRTNGRADKQMGEQQINEPADDWTSAMKTNKCLLWWMNKQTNSMHNHCEL
jgi:hypothetical protein